MAHAIIMPKAGMAMEEGTIIRWLKEVGDEVTVGESLLEIETDKVSMEVEAEHDGVLLSKLYDGGDVVAVVADIGYIGERGEKPPDGERDAQGARPAAPSAPPDSAAVAPEVASAGLPDAVSAGSPDIASASTPDAVPAGPPRATPLAKRLASEHRIPLADISASGRTGEILSRDVQAALHNGALSSAAPPPTSPAPPTSSAPPTSPAPPTFPAPPPPTHPARITPLALKIAVEHNVDLTAIDGSGPAGRINQADIQRALSVRQDGAPLDRATSPPDTSVTPIPHGTPSSAPPPQFPSPSPTPPGIPPDAPASPAHATPPIPTSAQPPYALGPVQSSSVQKIRGARKIIAARVYATHTTVPPVTLTHPARIDTLQTLRADIYTLLLRIISLTSWLSYAAIRALRRVPTLNATYATDREEITLHPDIHLGIAIDSPNGLLIPKISAANRLPFLAFEHEASLIIAATRAGTIEIDRLQGATFSITNLGMYGITHFTPIIPLPQVSMLGFAAAREIALPATTPRAPDTIREMNLLLTIDHRVIDGALGARYLAALADIISHPAQLLL